jgi:hypothetical protein
VNVLFITISPEKTIIANSYPSKNDTLNKNEQHLEFKTNDSTSNSSGLKVEIVAISGPVFFDSGDNHLSGLNHLINIYSKKKLSLISHSNLIISKTLHLSPLITKLQI